MKRYAIVRVDNCPSQYEKGFNDYFVCDGRGKDTRLGGDKINCKKCNYGDTKEQLVLKVSQALRRKIKDDKIVYIGISKKRNIRIETLAKEIVEFLGVME